MGQKLLESSCMRKVAFGLMIAVIAACGGSGPFGSDFTYPHSKTLAVELRNTTTDNVKLWVEPDETEPTTFMAGNSSRGLNLNRTWANESETITFRFKGREGANPIATATITINGQESHASNFSGFLVEWRKDPVTGTASIHATTQ